MKTKITILVGVVALVTLSFTFANVETSKNNKAKQELHSDNQVESPIGGIMSDEVVK